MVEPHRVAQPRTVEFVHRGAEVVQRGVQVDPRQCPVDLVVARGFVGLSRAGQARRTGGRVALQGNLDPATSLDIVQLLRRIHDSGTTIVMATHDNVIVDEMRKRVVELEDGVIIRDEEGGSYVPKAVDSRDRDEREADRAHDDHDDDHTVGSRGVSADRRR